MRTLRLSEDFLVAVQAIAALGVIPVGVFVLTHDWKPKQLAQRSAFVVKAVLAFALIPIGYLGWLPDKHGTGRVAVGMTAILFVLLTYLVWKKERPTHPWE